MDNHKQQNSSLELPNEIPAAGNIEESARLLGEVLGLSSSAPIPATRRAIDDPRYASALLATRKLPEIRDKLLYQDSPSNSHIIRKASSGMLKWGMDGMKPAPPWVIERRLKACNSCVHQIPAPAKLIYRGVEVATGKDAKICEVCDCLTNTKAAIVTEHCPVKNPENHLFSMWGETWVPPEQHPTGPW